MRRGAVALAGLICLTSMMSAVVGGSAAGAAASASSVHTVLGPGVVDEPGGIALSAAGDLFVADPGHCRVLVVPARSGVLDGLRVRAGRPTTVAGGSCPAGTGNGTGNGAGTGSGSIGHPSGVAVDGRGDVFIAEGTAQRVQEMPAGSHRVVTVAGTGTGGFNGDGLAATASELNQPTGVAVDAAGDLFIADTANCRVRVLPAANVTLFGRTMTAGHLFTVAGTGVCGSAGQGGPVTSAQLWNPIAVTLDAAGDLLVADAGDQSVLLAPVHAGSFYGSAVGADDIGVVVGGSGGYGPYLADGLPANGATAELNDLRGIALGPTGALFVADGFMHVIRVVPAVDGTLLGRPMKAGGLYTLAGALPVSTPEGGNDGTRWVLTQMGTPVGLAASRLGVLYFSDSAHNMVRAVPSGAGTP